MTKITCAVVRDLLPSYVEGLTSTDTNALVEEHLVDCAQCRNTIETMRMKMGEPQGLGEDDHREIDFLKRNRKRNRRIVLASVIVALLTIGLVIAVRTYVIGSATPAGSVASTVTIDKTNLAVELIPMDSANGIARVTFEEQDGVVGVSTKSVLASPLHPGSLRATYQAATPIKQVCVNGRTVWADGSEVSALASEVFETRHAYVGDMSANGRTLMALGTPNYLGQMQHELQTEEEPYGWTIYLLQDVVAKHQALMESDMRSYAYVLVGLIDNLDTVTFRYTVDGQEQELTVTAKDATSFLGQDIKGCASSVRLLDELLDKTGLTALAAA